MRHPSYGPTRPNLTLAARRLRLSQAQETLAAVRRREVPAQHSDRACWARDLAQAQAEVADATARLREVRS